MRTIEVYSKNQLLNAFSCAEDLMNLYNEPTKIVLHRKSGESIFNVGAIGFRSKEPVRIKEKLITQGGNKESIQCLWTNQPYKFKYSKCKFRDSIRRTIARIKQIKEQDLLV